MTKRNQHHRRLLFIFCLLLFFSSVHWSFSTTSEASVRLPRVFGNNMVLQRNTNTTIWGWATSGERIVVEICGQRKATIADLHGRWRVILAPQPAGGPFKMTVRGTNTITYDNVFYGEVWICAGQSNMSFPLKRSLKNSESPTREDYPLLRFLTIPTLEADEPQNDFSSKWETYSVKKAPELSALAFYFGLFLSEKLNVTVGIIVAAAIGSTCEAWIEREALAIFPDLSPLLDEKRISRLTSYQKPGNLFNGMIHPLLSYPVKGIIWYQGESNITRAHQYQTLFPLLISNWRKKFENEEIAFIYVQLPNFMKSPKAPSSSALAELREAQHQALSLRNVAEVVTIDVGEADNFHPNNKKEIAIRLANTALATQYGQSVPWTGPIYNSMRIVNDKIYLSFDFIEGGLEVGNNATCDSSKLEGFAIAGEDRIFYWGTAVIDGAEVIVHSTNVPHPVAVRYAWADNPVCNLSNQSGLPASPFRTDSWEGVTANVK